MIGSPPTVARPSLEGVEKLLQYFDTAKIVPLDIEPVTTPAFRAELLESMRRHGQMVPGFVCPSPELDDDQRLCIEGNNRLWCNKQLGLPFWAFDFGRFVPEAERIEHIFTFNTSRRVVSREEIAARAARWMEITGKTAAEAAKHLNVSPPTLSRAFGDQRIPTELKPRAELLGPSIRSLIAALPPPLMTQAIEFAETPGPDDRKPTRDQVALYLGQLKKTGGSKARKVKAITLRMEGRPVTFAVAAGDSAATVSKDLSAIVAKLAKLGDVPPEGWQFHFK